MFTDKDLEELKSVIGTTHRSVGPKIVLALIERLEAAERFMSVVVRGGTDLPKGSFDAYQEWEKVAGK